MHCSSSIMSADPRLQIDNIWSLSSDMVYCYLIYLYIPLLTAYNKTAKIVTTDVLMCWCAVSTVAVGYPLTVIGAVFGRSTGGTFDAPSRPKPVAREIPSVAWYRTPVVHCVIGGFLPFRLKLQMSPSLLFIFFYNLGNFEFYVR